MVFHFKCLPFFYRLHLSKKGMCWTNVWRSKAASFKNSNHELHLGWKSTFQSVGGSCSSVFWKQKGRRNSRFCWKSGEGFIKRCLLSLLRWLQRYIFILEMPSTTFATFANIVDSDQIAYHLAPFFCHPVDKLSA